MVLWPQLWSHGDVHCDSVHAKSAEGSMSLSSVHTQARCDSQPWYMLSSMILFTTQGPLSLHVCCLIPQSSLHHCHNVFPSQRPHINQPMPRPSHHSIPLLVCHCCCAVGLLSASHTEASVAPLWVCITSASLWSLSACYRALHCVWDLYDHVKDGCLWLGPVMARTEPLLSGRRASFTH